MAGCALVAGCALLLALADRGGAYSGGDTYEGGHNPCIGPESHKLLCPNLKISRPSDMYITTSPGGRRLLHAQSSINSRGAGPLEIHGIRIPGTDLMRVNQRIYKKGGGKLVIRTQAKLAFYPIPGQYRYWKLRDAARFELWTVDAQRHRVRQVRTGPKFYYCQRDLERTDPGLAHSPRNPVYPHCSQDPGRRSVTLGVSVGWSDIYPSGYHQQFINVSGLRGCYAFRMVADPKNHLRESNENDNASRVLIRLPSGHVGC